MSAKTSRKSSQTDWKRVDALSDADIDTSEIPGLDKRFFEKATVRLPRRKSSITVRLDSDVLEWFRALGRGYQTHINAVLRMYMEARLKEQPNRSVEPTSQKLGGSR